MVIISLPVHSHRHGYHSCFFVFIVIIFVLWLYCYEGEIAAGSGSSPGPGGWSTLPLGALSQVNHLASQSTAVRSLADVPHTCRDVTTAAEGNYVRCRPRMALHNFKQLW